MVTFKRRGREDDAHTAHMSMRRNECDEYPILCVQWSDINSSYTFCASALHTAHLQFCICVECRCLVVLGDWRPSRENVCMRDATINEWHLKCKYSKLKQTADGYNASPSSIVNIMFIIIRLEHAIDLVRREIHRNENGLNVECIEAGSLSCAGAVRNGLWGVRMNKWQTN